MHLYQFMDQVTYPTPLLTPPVDAPLIAEGHNVVGKERSDSPNQLAHPHAPRHLKTRSRALWGVISFVPILALVAAGIAAIAGNNGLALVIGVFHLFWMFVCLIFMGNQLLELKLPKSRMTTWLIAFFVAGPLSIPAFWLSHVWFAPHAPVEHN